MKVADLEVDGKKIALSVSEWGEFTAVLDGEPYKADTLEKLKQKLVRARRREAVRVSIPATLASTRGRGDDNESLIDVEVTGIHQRNRNILYRRLDTGKAGDTDYNDTLLKRLEPEGKAKYLKLLKEKVLAANAFDSYKRAQTLTKEIVVKQVADAEKVAGLEPVEE